MSDLLIRSSQAPAAGGASVKLSGPSALRYVGFEVHQLGLGEARDWPADKLERCVVVLSGAVAVHTPQKSFTGIGSRQRKSPVGGCANGIALNTAPP